MSEVNRIKSLYTVQEAATYLGVSRMKVYRLLEGKELTAELHPLDKRKKLIPLQQLDRLKYYQVGLTAES